MIWQNLHSFNLYRSRGNESFMFYLEVRGDVDNLQKNSEKD